MASSMIAGEKKWASARRSGMTVLGKVAVPKPINLPSQKLENHGLDPNVEIVPKGTLSWGSQSSSVPNAWGSSSISPNADNSTNSPSHLSGRPSSGSGGTRPSTAGSDRAQDSTPNVWGPNSRPSSASGPLASNQTALSSLRPCSAETRPGSSQLSRFAEHPSPSDNPPTWGPNGSSNKLGLAPFNNDGFSLSSGDFPSLGSEKDSLGKNIDSQEHGYNSRPSSSSSRTASGKEKTLASSVGNVKGEPPNTWTREGSQLPEYTVHPPADRWQGDIPPGGIHHRPPQHFDTWHGPPMNPPSSGGWYRGPPRGPPYSGPLHPNSFPMEPFHFYRPQMPPQQVPPGAAPRGGHFSEGYIRPHPRMQMNPGFYPAPVPYEGFYGPPMGYGNPNERDMSFMGRPPGVPVRHPYGPRSGNSDDNTQGQYKVLLKQSNNWDEKRGEEEEWEHEFESNIVSISKKDQPQARNEWGLEDESSFSKSTMIQKIDSMNAKARNFDNRPDAAILSGDDRYNQPQPHISGVAPSRDPSYGVRGRVDNHGKRLNNKPLAEESSAEVPVMNLETNSNVLVRDRPNIELNIQGKDEGDYSMLMVDESDTLAQRAKMREIAKQRAEKLQKEEEERIREQKAKALAKLEELNRRSHISEAFSSQKLEKPLPGGTVHQEEETSRIESKTNSIKSKPNTSPVVQNRKDQFRASNSIMVGENKVVFEPDYKSKPSVIINPAKGILGKPVPSNNDSTDSEIIAVDVTQHKKKNSRSSKNKHKIDGVAHVSVENSEQDKGFDTHSTDDVAQHLTSVKGGRQWKPQQPRHVARNQQGNNRMEERETVTWAPVRSQNKIDRIENKSVDNADPVIDTTNEKMENLVQNNMKTKRAEIERYRPKPVAKELSQNIETTQHAIVETVPTTAEMKNRDRNQSKSSKETVKYVQKPIEQKLPLKSDVISSKDKTTDGWNSMDDSATSAPISTAVTKARVPAPVKKHPYKSTRDTSNSFEHDHMSSEIEKINSLNENRFGGGERMPQWQPKNQNYTNRSGRGYEFQRESHFNRERPRQSSHFEYQPVGNLDGGSRDESHSGGTKYRERNQGYQRRGGGNFYGGRGGDARNDR